MRMPVRFHIFLFLFLFKLCCSLVLFASGQCLQDQKMRLLQLKHNLRFHSSVSTKLVEWNQGSASADDDCCFWAGVTCDSSGHVVGLDLSKESISGGINETSSLFSFRFLQRLSLAENAIDSAHLPSNFGKLASLNYLNLSDSGFSGQIPRGFSELTRLVSLDLSSPRNENPFQLENPNLESLVQNFRRLRGLYLDGMNLSAKGQDWCRVLSSSVPDLQVLSLSNCELSGHICSSLGKLKSLTVIRLDYNSFSGQIPDFFQDFPNLTVLSFRQSEFDLRPGGFSGLTPEKIFQVPTLQTIDLSGNVHLGGSLPEFPEDSSLQHLLLSSTQFSGILPDSIGNLKLLSELDLSHCNFTGPIPSSVVSLTQLAYVDLSFNHFNGSVPFFNRSRNLTTIKLSNHKFSGHVSFLEEATFDNLKSLDLSNNSLEGQIPGNIFFMPSLRFLTLSLNKFSGPISEASNKDSFKLETLDLSSNNLQGLVPDFLFDLPYLTTLNLSFNQFNGTLEFMNFRKLSQLVSLDLSCNKLVVETDSTYLEPPSLPKFNVLKLASCSIRKFPFLRNQSGISELDFSNNQIAGEIPAWLWEGDKRDRVFNLSHNQLTHFQEPYSLQNLYILDLHSNLLTGKLPIPPTSTATYLDFSNNNFVSSIPADIGNYLINTWFYSIANNKLVGGIPESLCNARDLEVLNLSNNSLSNSIPPCLLDSSGFLRVLNLGQNNLSGHIPEITIFNCILRTFDLSRNQLEGKLPVSLSECSRLEVLDIGHNRIDDNFPCWINKLSNLHILVLRNNHFHGNLTCPGNNYSWPNLQIVDLAINNLSGEVPSALFSGLKAMTVEGNHSNTLPSDNLGVTATIGYYQDSVSVIYKGREAFLLKIGAFFTAIDFSSNQLQGNLPETVGELQNLHVLTFSNNSITGPMPPSIGKLKQLDSLDLSFNHLSGEIPTEISGLTFLSFLNLSYNELVGRIPVGGQMHSFREDSFLGNIGLCCFPVYRSSNSSASPPDSPLVSSEENEKVSRSDIYISATIGFVVSLLAMYWLLLFSKEWRIWYNSNLDRFFLAILLGQQSRRQRRRGPLK